MWGITAYFNSQAYSTKLKNLGVFAKHVRQQGLALCVIELAYPGTHFSVPETWADMVLRFTATSVLWQKERLFNLALSQLPLECEYVVCLDGDILFDNARWVEQTRALLKRHKIVQPYQTAVWLPQDAQDSPSGQIDRLKVIAKPGVAYARVQPSSPRGIEYRPDLVHPGFAWAARRKILQCCGIYDKFIIGGGDFFNMLPMFFDLSLIAQPMVFKCLSREQMMDFQPWAERFHAAVKGDVASTPGTVYHLWHGDLSGRRYIDRYEILRDSDFDPKSDIIADGNGCWMWSSQKPEMHRRVAEYFESRREDG